MMQTIKIINLSAVSCQNNKLNSTAQTVSHSESYKNTEKLQNKPSDYLTKTNYSDIKFSGSFYLPSILHKDIKKGSFMSNNKANNEIIDKRLNFEYDRAVKTQNVSGLMEFVDSNLPPLQQPNSLNKTDNIIETKIGSDARIELMQKNGERLFITEEELRAAGRDEPTVLTAKGGIRLCDPYDQKNWPKALQRIWPPADSTAGDKVLKKLTPIANGNIIETNDSVGKEYEVHPSGIVVTDKTKGRIYIFSRLENHHPSINWGTWVIAPFKVSKENGAVALVPHYENDDTARIQNNKKWEKRNKYILLDTVPDGEMSDIVGNANHAIIAKSASKDAFVIRRLSGQNGKIKVHCPAGKNCEYVELEHMGPEVPSGENSSIAYVIDIVPKELISEEFSKERNVLKEQTVKLAEKIEAK